MHRVYVLNITKLVFNHRLCLVNTAVFYNRGATTSGTGSPKPEGEIAEAEASTPGKEPGRGFCEIQ